jgi:hypothetical protein
MGKRGVFKLAIHWWILGEIISGIGKHKDVIKIGEIKRVKSSEK